MTDESERYYANGLKNSAIDSPERGTESAS